jgi:hypothetical protein
MKTRKFILSAVACAIGVNAFAQWNDTGDNSATGDLTIGSAFSSKLTIKSSVNVNSYGDLVFNTPDRNSLSIIRGQNMGYGKTNLQFLTSPQSNVSNPQVRMYINPDGKIGIGTENPQASLDVRGAIQANDIKVVVAQGADFVFAPDYKLPALSEVESFVKENKHLPEIQSEKDMQQNGVNLNELQIKLLQKVEELTLYVIQQNKRIEELEQALEKTKQP